MFCTLYVSRYFVPVWLFKQKTKHGFLQCLGTSVPIWMRIPVFLPKWIMPSYLITYHRRDRPIIEENTRKHVSLIELTNIYPSFCNKENTRFAHRHSPRQTPDAYKTVGQVFLVVRWKMKGVGGRASVFYSDHGMQFGAASAAGLVVVLECCWNSIKK